MKYFFLQKSTICCFSDNWSISGLGHTIKELDLAAYKIPVFEKTKFTMCIPPVEKFFGSQLESVILCGIEGHVCVLQTTLDFLKKGIHVHVVADGITSRTQTDRFVHKNYPSIYSLHKILSSATSSLFFNFLENKGF